MIDKTKLPKHIAIIMDGNRRWARKKGLPDGKGHEAGAKNLEDIVEYCRDIGIKHLTVYALSTENWRLRPSIEVKGLFDLLVRIVRTKAVEYQKSGIKFFVLGNFQAFPFKVRDAIKKILAMVIVQEKIQFNIALNYGGRDEIVNAIKNIIKNKIPANKIDEKLISDYLYTKDQPDPDLVIRPGGEFRLSNFLLWQMSYAELYFTNILWPDFTPKKMEKAIEWYQQRERRMGK
ncbi:di-trans,poly-cis-decaprenylcistransferase [Candidatus Shapirobacteria bacterium CG_4_8_14_3_um_filter_35_11]|uniref:Isoprenyl transferase n=4 Tax=Candidatus Shapironibacteriota TaxID=1752721 RepID=A0A1J5I4D0_9BACT|nr:MAG: di-trans,poly-cis-decaprenylcistransferase [Candidatus Shapirobacteria bacterium CG2_30_35_20]PJC81171.1 MAG: di-trans,poly-cis-decaprenylcistransferase [Candidatus Shapirobacteria bacterium CG_4_8_14_3_um_filter_35_11]PJE66863.1 MAG: di-trans,poly-cis-decaprenylcistransferase [Candidatus Shapirobacteria bacterium CG10_big_fil_rev_8_21_14_0_10_36_6]